MNLNPAVMAMQRYLDLIRPWCIGEWDANSFRSEEAATRVADASYYIFPIPERNLPDFTEQALLGDKRARALMLLISWVKRFNSIRELIGNLRMYDKVKAVTTVHGVIGKKGDGTLHDVFADAEASL